MFFYQSCYHQSAYHGSTVVSSGDSTEPLLASGVPKIQTQNCIIYLNFAHSLSTVLCSWMHLHALHTVHIGTKLWTLCPPPHVKKMKLSYLKLHCSVTKLFHLQDNLSTARSSPRMLVHFGKRDLILETRHLFLFDRNIWKCKNTKRTKKAN